MITIRSYDKYPLSRFNELYELGYPDHTGWFKAALRKKWVLKSWLAYRKGKVIGWSCIYKRPLCIPTAGVYISYKYRHKGLGSKLLKKALQSGPSKLKWFNAKKDKYSTKRSNEWTAYQRKYTLVH